MTPAYPLLASAGTRARFALDGGDELVRAAEAGNDPVATAGVFLDLVRSGRLSSVPLPGVETSARFGALFNVAAGSPAVARLVEGHLDAVAIFAELGGTLSPGAVYGVWASEWDGHRLSAEQRGTGWHVRGIKPFASGAGCLTHALVTARAGNDQLLFVIEVSRSVAPIEGSWPSVGMAGTDSRSVEIEAVVDGESLVGEAGSYAERPGFWHGAAGVAACWLGGAHAVAQPMFQRIGADPHVDAHAGAVDVALSAAGSLLAEVALGIDEDPLDHSRSAELSALRVRAAVEQAVTVTLERVGRALGAAPLCLDPVHGRRVSDLATYVRQSHAERDLARLARLRDG